MITIKENEFQEKIINRCLEEDGYIKLLVLSRDSFDRFNVSMRIAEMIKTTVILQNEKVNPSEFFYILYLLGIQIDCVNCKHHHETHPSSHNQSPASRKT